MNCYGWIPTLVGEDIFNTLGSEFASCSERLPEDLNRAVKKFIIDALKWDISNKSKILVISANLFDFKKSNNLVFLKFDSNWKIENITIVEGDFKKIMENREDTAIIADARIVYHGNGLIGIILEYFDSKTYKRENVNRQIFRIVRDIYHVHTHHKHQDVLLEPVYAADCIEARYKILKQYLKK